MQTSLDLFSAAENRGTGNAQASCDQGKQCLPIVRQKTVLMITDEFFTFVDEKVAYILVVPCPF